MIHFAVINFKNLIKNFIKFSFVIAFMVGIMNAGEVFSSRCKSINYAEILKRNFSFQEKGENKNLSFSVIEKEIPIHKDNIKVQTLSTNTKIIEEPKEEKIEEDLNAEKKESKEKNEEDSKVENVEEIIVEEIPVKLPTEVIKANNLQESYNTIYKDIKIKNETNFNLSQEILTPNVEFVDKENIIIFHTHTCESYTSSKENSYVFTRKL